MMEEVSMATEQSYPPEWESYADIANFYDRVRGALGLSSATDIANAIYDGTTAIMLSGESAAGLYPVEAVKTMAKIADGEEFKMPATIDDPAVLDEIKAALALLGYPETTKP